MGEVYRAEDARLGREVAIKVLPEDFIADPERLARFEREARVLAALDHPNIAALYEVGEAQTETDGSPVCFLVMGLAAGETLEERIARGPVPLDEAVAIALRVAEALEAAHNRGVVHRDLKPANVKVDAEGHVKVLDFGLAKAWAGDPAEARDSELTQSPTLTGHGSGHGVLLGTAAYMAPEQARGQPVDPRADVWAFGAVLYEMLTGLRAFQGDTVSDCLAAVLKEAPDFSALPSAVPVRLRRLLERCLDKDVRTRLQAVGEARIVLDARLEGGADGSVEGASPVATGSRRSTAGLAWGLAALAAVAAVVGWQRTVRAPVGPAPPRMTAEPLTWFGGQEVQPTLSPDGDFVAYASDADGDWDVYLLRVGGDRPINLTADSDADDLHPAFSPDGEAIAFRSERDGGGIFVMGATGESVRRLTDFGYNPSWSPNGERLAVAGEGVQESPLSREAVSRLWIVEVADGAAEPLPGEQDRVQPAWSPHGERIAYWGLPQEGGQRDVWTVSADGSDPRPVTAAPSLDWSPTWSPDGRHLYFSSDRGGSLALWRAPIDESSGSVVGELEPLQTPASWGAQARLASDGSAIVFTSLDQRANVGVVAVSADAGEVTGQPRGLTRGSVAFGYLDVAPDASRLVLARSDRREDLFIVDADGSGLRRLTDDVHKDRGPRWSPDGSTIVFYSDRSGSYELWRIRPDGSGLERLTDGPEGGPPAIPVFSPDGTRIAALGFDGSIVFDLAGGPPHDVVATTPPLSSSHVFALSDWAPGDRMVGLAWTPGTSYYLDEVVIFDLATEAYSRIPAPGFDHGEISGIPRWLPGGRFVLLSSDGDVYRIDVTTGEVRLVMRAPPGVRYAKAQLGPDGATLYFLRVEVEADLWLGRLDGSELEGSRSAR